MTESTTATADTDQFSNPASGARTADGHYANKPSQLAPWHERLRQRRITLRKIALYAVVAAIVVLSSPTAPTFILGCLLVATGLALRIWTFGHLEKNEDMITTGPFAHSRNPAYLGSFLIFSGFVLAAGDPASIAGIAIWVAGLAMLAVFFFQYLPRKYAREYPRLEKAFPEGFKAHAANVPDFFPRLTPWRSGDTRSFSWACVTANHELWWTILLSAGMALLWFV